MKGAFKYMVLAGVLLVVPCFAGRRVKAVQIAEPVIEAAAVEVVEGEIPMGMRDICADCAKCPDVAPCIEAGDKVCTIKRDYPPVCFVARETITSEQPFYIKGSNECVECNNGVCRIKGCGPCRPSVKCPCPPRRCCTRPRRCCAPRCNPCD